MTTARTQRLAYDLCGEGVPVVLLPGLTFRRESWQPVTERLGDGILTIAIDLPGHGDTAGPPARLDDLVDEIHGLVSRLGVERPLMVGHSMSGIVVFLYAARHPARGVVCVDQPLLTGPFASQVKQLEPRLRSSFDDAFKPFLHSMGIDLIPEPLRSHARAAQEVRQDVVLGYWDEVIRRDPGELQATLDSALRAAEVPALCIFGRQLPAPVRAHLANNLAHATVEEWPGAGHCPHLARVDEFAARLREFALGV